VRTPLRTENGFGLEFPIFPGGYVRIVGNPELKAETVVAGQAGVRAGFGEALFLDVAVFYNDYDNLIIQRAGAPLFEPSPPPGRTIFPAVYSNAGGATTRGVEVAVQAQPLARWHVAGSASFYRQSTLSDPLGFGSITGVNHQFQLHSNVTLLPNLEWNANYYYVGGSTPGEVGSFNRLDVQLLWTPHENWQHALGVRNAIHPNHDEARKNSENAFASNTTVCYLNALAQF
jgi:iron complex outermembrane receptor protein